MNPQFEPLVEPDQHVYANLATFVNEVFDIALDEHDTFWWTMLEYVHSLRTQELARLYREVDTCGLRGILVETENAADHHYDFIPQATYARVVEALLGTMKDPVSAYEIYEANGFFEKHLYLEAFEELFRSTDTPRTYGLWLVEQAYLGNRFAVLRTQTNSMPDWYADRRAAIDNPWFNRYVPNNELQPGHVYYRSYVRK